MTGGSDETVDRADESMKTWGKLYFRFAQM